MPPHQAEIDFRSLELFEEHRHATSNKSPEATGSRQPEVRQSDHAVSRIQDPVEEDTGWADAFHDADESADDHQKGHSETNGNHHTSKAAADKEFQEGSSIHSSANIEGGGGEQEPSGSEDSWGDSFQEAASDLELEADAQPALKTSGSHSVQEAEQSSTNLAITEEPSTATATTAEPEDTEVGTDAVQPPSAEATSSQAGSRDSKNGLAGDGVSPAGPETSVHEEGGLPDGASPERASTMANPHLAEDEGPNAGLREPKAEPAQPNHSESRRLEEDEGAVAAAPDNPANLGHLERHMQDGIDIPEPSMAPADLQEGLESKYEQNSPQEDSGTADLQNEGSIDNWNDDDAWGEPAFQEAPIDSNKPASDAASVSLGGELAEQPLLEAHQETEQTETTAPHVNPDAYDKLQDLPRNTPRAEEGGLEKIAEAKSDTAQLSAPSQDVLDSGNAPLPLHLRTAKQACLEVGWQLSSKRN